MGGKKRVKKGGSERIRLFSKKSFDSLISLIGGSHYKPIGCPARKRDLLKSIKKKEQDSI